MHSPMPIPEKFRDLPLPPPSRGYDWGPFAPFILLHVAVLGALWTGASWVDWTVCGVLYAVRMFAVTGAYHRYFSHRTYKTSRWFQFVLAFLAQTSSQKGALWWAAHHRNHHKYSDLPWDVHSPIQKGFWYSHVLWLVDRGTETTDYSRIKDLAKYPELVWLNKNWLVPPVALGVAVWWLFGWSGLWIGFCLSTVLGWHVTFFVNSLAHVWGKRRFPTEDTSRNNWWIGLITFGEGWHNNHHHYMGSTRQGWYWWEIDITYYILRGLAAVGLIWDLRPVPEAILAEGRARDAAARRGEAMPLSESVPMPEQA
jgi:stearoyl-CoA desaturase (Delta-9 desaturase)